MSSSLSCFREIGVRRIVHHFREIGLAGTYFFELLKFVKIGVRGPDPDFPKMVNDTSDPNFRLS